MTIRPAQVGDVPALVALIRFHADRGRMVPRSADELYTHLRSYFVAEVAGRVIGCAASHIFWHDLAELKSLAVADGWQGQGVGKSLCLACHAQLQQLGVRQVFALTGAPGFFLRLGYRRVDKESLPRYIWGECVRCPSFPECNEEALLLDLSPGAGQAPPAETAD